MIEALIAAYMVAGIACAAYTKRWYGDDREWVAVAPVVALFWLPIFSAILAFAVVQRARKAH